MLSDVPRTAPCTGSFQIDVLTSRPRHSTSRGPPTFNETTCIAETLSWLFHMERFLQPRNHPRLVVLLIGIFPRPHAVSAGLDGDDVAWDGNLPHGVAQQRRLLVGNLIV